MRRKEYMIGLFLRYVPSWEKRYSYGKKSDVLKYFSAN